MQHVNTDRSATPNELEYDEILDQIGYGKTQWILLIVSGLLTITSVAAQQAMGIVVLASHCEFQTTQAEKGVMMAACVAGIFLSTYVCGYVSDAIGRRTVLLYGIFTCTALQFILMFVTSVWLFNIINLICGISLGGVSGGLYPYLSEFNIPRHRAVTINYSTMFVSLTAIYVPATAWLILSSDWSINLIAVLCMFFSSNGMQFWFPEIVNRTSNRGSNSSSTVCEILDNSFMQPVENESMTDTAVCTNPISTKTYIDNMIVGTAFLIGFSVQGLLLNPFGRKNVLMGALTVTILSGILLHIVSNSTAVLVLFCLYILLPGLSISIMIGAIVDLVPTHLRGKAVSLSMSLGRLGIIAATNLIGIMLQPYCNSTFALLTFILIVCIITVYRLPIKNSE
ncbi:hypothetical protein ACLKA7_007928 [Drosophila subpalustris]